MNLNYDGRFNFINDPFFFLQTTEASFQSFPTEGADDNHVAEKEGDTDQDGFQSKFTDGGNRDALSRSLCCRRGRRIGHTTSAPLAPASALAAAW